MDVEAEAAASSALHAKWNGVPVKQHTTPVPPSISKKTLAMWRKQLKNLKSKDAAKKMDSLRYCAQNEQFVREQSEVLPLLMEQLGRLKAPNVIAETLRTFKVLFTQTEIAAIVPQSADSPPPSSTEPPTMVEVHPEQNRQLVLELSCTSDKCPWKAGEPFVVLFLANVAPEIKIQAIDVFRILLDHCTQLAIDRGQTDFLQALQTSGTPTIALLPCLSVDHASLQLAALECIHLLFQNPPSAEFLTTFHKSEGLEKIQQLAQQPERHFHSALLKTFESFSRHEIGRVYLRASGAADVVSSILVATVETTTATIAAATATPPAPITLTVEQAELMHANVSVACRSYARVLFATEALADRLVDFQGEYATVPLVVEALVAILQNDISTIVSPSLAPAAPTGTSATALAAAAAAAATAATLSSLFSFSSVKCIDIITSLGRMVEKSELVKRHCKAKELLPVLLLAFRVPNDDALHQSADKLLHLCSRVCSAACEADEDASSTPVVAIDPQLFSSGVAPADDDASAPPVDSPPPPLLTLENVIPTLDAATNGDSTTTTSGVVFRLVRWLAVVMDAPPNARVLGEGLMTMLVKILLQTVPSEIVLCGFLAKCIQAIATLSPEACELCSSETSNPVGALTAFLSTAYVPMNSMLSHRAVSVASEIHTPSTEETEKSEHTIAAEATALAQYKLEWLSEDDEPGTFDALSLTRQCHAFDPLWCGAKAIEALATTHARARVVSGDASASVDFADLLAQRLDAAGKASTSAAALAAAAAAKKKLGEAVSVKAAGSGEGVVLSVLEKTPEIFRLLEMFSSKNGSVAVSLLTTIRALLQLPGGVRAMLILAKAALDATLVVDSVQGEEPALPVSVSRPPNPTTFPWTREESKLTEFVRLVAPILSVFETPVTCFFQLEAAVGVLSAMVEDPPDPPATSPPSTTGIISFVEIAINDTDRLLNAALSQGILVYLVAALDDDRVPLCPKDQDRRSIFAESVVALVHKFIQRGSVKQTQADAKRQELLDLHEQLMSTAAAAAAAANSGGKNAKQENGGQTIDVASLQSQKLEFKTKWATELLDAVFDTPRFTYRRVSALLLATQIGQDDIARTLLNAGVSPDSCGSLDATTPLMLALLTKNKPLTNALLDAGASVDAITKDGLDITVWACALTSPVREDIGELISHIHSSTVVNKIVLPLDALIELDEVDGAPNIELFGKLLGRGLDVNVSNADGDFVTHALLSMCIVRQQMRGLDLCFRYDSSRSLDPSSLLRLVSNVVEHHNADIDACNRLGQTPLHVALLHGHVDAVLYLLGRGANPNVQDAFGLLPLHYACLGFFASSDQAIDVIKTLLLAAAKHELVQGQHADRRKYKSALEKAAVDVDLLLDRGFAEVSCPPALVRTVATVDQVLTTRSASPDGFLPWHLACGACSHLNASLVCLSDHMNTTLQSNGAIRGAILGFLEKTHNISLDTRTGRQLTGLHLAVKTDVDGSNQAILDVLLGSSVLGAILNVVHDPAPIDSMPPIPERALVELTTDALLYVPLAHASTRSLQHKYHVILPDGTHLDDLDRHQLTVSSECISRYTLRLESAFSALHYAVQVSDELSRRLLALPGIAIQPDGSDLPLLALSCAARRAADVVASLVNAQSNVRVHLPLHNGSSHEHSGDGNGSGSVAAAKGSGSGRGRAASGKQAAALHFAVIYEDLELVRALVSRKDHTNVNVRRSGDGFTPLHLACGMGNVEIIKLLLDYSANLIQMSTVSSSSSGVTPLHLLLKADGMDNDLLKELIERGYIKRELLLEGLGAPAVFTAQATIKHDQQREPAGTGTGTGGKAGGVATTPLNDDDEDDNEIEISCVLLDEEEHNLSLYNHVQQLRATKRGATGYAKRLHTELGKSDEVLTLFFKLIAPPATPRSRTKSLSLVTEEDAHATDSPRPSDNRSSTSQEEEASIRDARHQFVQLKHWHECYAQQCVRSRWEETAPTPTTRRSSFNRRSTRELIESMETDTASVVAVPES